MAKADGPIVVVLGAIPVAFLLGLVVAQWSPIISAPLFARGPLARVRPALEYVGSPDAPRAILGGLAVSVVGSAMYLGAMRCIVAALGATPDPAVGLVGRLLGYSTAAVGALLYVLRQHGPASTEKSPAPRDPA